MGLYLTGGTGELMKMSELRIGFNKEWIFLRDSGNFCLKLLEMVSGNSGFILFYGACIHVGNSYIICFLSASGITLFGVSVLFLICLNCLCLF